MNINTSKFKGFIKKKKFTQSEFANRLGTTQGNLSSWINRGVIPDKYEKKILELLGVTANELKCEPEELYSNVSEPREYYAKNKTTAHLLFDGCDEVQISFENCARIRTGDFIGLKLVDVSSIEKNAVYLLDCGKYSYLRISGGVKNNAMQIFNHEETALMPLDQIKKLYKVLSFASNFPIEMVANV